MSKPAAGAGAEAEAAKKARAGRPADDEPLKKYDYPQRRNVDFTDVNRGFEIIGADGQLVLGAVAVALVAFAVYLWQHFNGELVEVFTIVRQEIYQAHPKDFYVAVFVVTVTVSIVVWIITVFLLTRPRKVHLVDFAVFTPEDKYKVPAERFMANSRATGFFSEEALQFQEKLLSRTGLGEETYFPPGVLKLPPSLTMEDAREESRLVLFSCLRDLFARTGVKPTDVDILIVNCSLFNPTPSLSAMVANEFKMRSNIKSFNLAGMGCSAGLISIDLAKDLLQVHKNSIAVVCSFENITQNWYRGLEKSMLVTNTLFRMGGAAIMLTNKPKLAARAKYRLYTTVRVHKGAKDEAYNAVYQLQDAQGFTGVRLAPGKELMAVVGDALKTNMTTLGPIVLPYSEQIKFLWNLFRRKYLGAKIAPYVPDFKKAFQHFCIHAGGRAIIDGLEQNLQLEERHVEPSRATLYRYGNTSSSSIWYELAFIERKGNMRRGDKVWQIAVGSGFKCNSAVWVCARTPTPNTVA